MYSLDYTTSFGWDACKAIDPGVLVSISIELLCGQVVEALDADQEVPGSGPTGNRDFVPSGYTQP